MQFEVNHLKSIIGAETLAEEAGFEPLSKLTKFKLYINGHYDIE